MKVMNGLRTVALMIAVVGLVSKVSAESSSRSARIPFAQPSGSSSRTAVKADLSGKWDLDVKTDGGPISAKADFKVASDATITGTIESAEYGNSKIASGSVADASFAIKFSVSADGNVIEINMSGTFDEKSMRGSGTAGDGSFSFTGTRTSNAQGLSSTQK
jgi:hypothetical protein